ncbi:hypothetical protein [Sporosarcina sp. E16_8]|uniref:hypothetical protein n=1 Tax=Sporosarcina sp. E16_8 TaxID=2789295 RepID=UPI001A92380F|nr:hypothetical protein [Sporosarcina sp. E16_8]MBO0587450.1 hypothetical protein [Sporosarcina sp. E16_8]
MQIRHGQLKYFMEVGKIPRLDIIDADTITFNYGFYLGIQSVHSLHEANEIPAQSLEKSWKDTQEYINRAIEYLEDEWSEETYTTTSYYQICLDNEVLYHLWKDLGNPPLECCPIYIITVGSDKNEKVVYIGQTSSKKSRFKGGHLAALKLHDPIYNGIVKNIYLANIMLLSKSKKYIPLEYISTIKGSKSILSEVEASLIFYFKPELNIHHKFKQNYKISSQIHIQNFSYYSNFLHDHFIGV